MGIHGLFSFIHKNYPSLASPLKLSKDDPKTIIVDGNAFTHHISHLISPCFGAMYYQIQMQIHTTISEWKGLGLDMIFVFDGSLIDIKRDERIKRLNANLKKIQSCTRMILNAKTQSLSKGIILPCMMMPCTLFVLHEMQIPIRVAEFEADVYIASLAKTRDAFVLSNDSDFLILDSKGLIPISSLHGNECVLYEMSKISKMLRIPEYLMPLLPGLIGNDYSGGIYKSKSDQRIIQDCIKLLVNQSGSLEHVAERICKELHGNLNELLLASYPYILSKSFSVESHLSVQGFYDSRLTEIQAQNVFWCTPLMENIQQESCWECSLSIRELIYSQVLLQHSNAKFMVEYIRKGMSIQYTQVVLDDSKSRITNIQEFVQVLHTPFDLYESVPTHYQPLILSLRFMIYEFHDKGTPLGNHIVVGMLVSCICSYYQWSLLLSSNTSSRNSNRNTSTRNEVIPTLSSLHYLAQLETILYNILLLHQSVFPYQSCTDDSHIKNIKTDYSLYWRILNGSIWHACFELARKGAHPRDIFDKMRRIFHVQENESLYVDFLELYSLCNPTIDMLDIVFHYDLSISI